MKKLFRNFENTRKAVLITLAFLFVSLSAFTQTPTSRASSQSPVERRTLAKRCGTNHWKYFFSNVPTNAKYRSVGAAGQNLWLFRPAVTITATEIYFSKEDDKTVMNTSALSSTGIGISYQHFINNVDGSLYNNFGVNALMLFGTEQASIKAAVTINLFQYLTLGAGYDFQINKVIFLTGAIIHFNK